MIISHSYEINQHVWILDTENSTVLPCTVLQVVIRIDDAGENVSYILLTTCGQTDAIAEEDIYETISEAFAALGATL